MQATPETIADAIGSIVNSTRYAHPVWAALPEEERQEMRGEWARIIRCEPECAAEKIVDTILARPGLGAAWRNLNYINGGIYRPNSIKHLVSLAVLEKSV
jgi:hypothetical protein